MTHDDITKAIMELQRVLHRSDVYRLRAVLEECREYFDSRADADYQGEESDYIPNEEMRLLVEIDEVLK